MTLHSITATYPGFQALPKGVKQMLLVTESVFFDEARVAQKTNRSAPLLSQPPPAESNAIQMMPSRSDLIQPRLAAH
jgi:hypothetical protein